MARAAVRTGYRLPADVGQAIAAYLRRRRPVSDRREMFLCARAPYARIVFGTVASTVRRASRRAGIPEVGSHRLRHTTACEMVPRRLGLAHSLSSRPMPDSTVDEDDAHKDDIKDHQQRHMSCKYQPASGPSPSNYSGSFSSGVIVVCRRDRRQRQEAPPTNRTGQSHSRRLRRSRTPVTDKDHDEP